MGARLGRPAKENQEFGGKKAFLSAVVVMLVVAIGAAYVLDGRFQRSSSEANTRMDVRLGDPGHNLVQY